MNKNIKSKNAIFLIALILISTLSALSLQGANAATISFTCSADLKTTTAGVNQNGQYTIILNNTGSAKMGSANITIPKGYSNIVAPIALTDYPSGQTWTATISAQPTSTTNGTIIIQGSANGLDHNEIVAVSFYVKNPAIVAEYQWLVSANQNTGEGGHDYQVVVVAFNQLITPAITTELSIAPSSTLIAGSIIYDTAQLTGTTPDATGTVTYTLYKGIYPNGVSIFQSQVEATPSNLPNVPNSEASQALTEVGQYYFLATYSGDEKNSNAIGVPEAFTVAADELINFDFSTISSPQVAGNPFIITIQAEDQYGNLILGYTKTNILTATEGVSLSPTSISFENGKSSQSITVNTIASAVTLFTADDQGHIGSSNAFDVTGSNPLKLTYTTSPQTLRAGAISNIITIQLQDSTGYPKITDTPRLVSLTTNSSTGLFYSDAAGNNKITRITIQAGQSSANFYYNDTTAGTAAIAASTPNVNSAVTYFTVRSALEGTSKFALSVPESVQAGQNLTATITAQDIYGNKVTTYSGIVQISASDYQAILPANFALIDGAGSFNLILKTSGIQTVTATDTAHSSITGSTTTQVTADSTSTAHFTVTAPDNADAGTSITFTVTAKDQYGNTVTGYMGTVQFSSTDDQATLPAATSLNQGTVSLAATLKTAGAQTITAADTKNTITGTSNSIQVQANTNLQSIIVISPDAATINAGEQQTFIAQLCDPYNNPIEDITNSVTWVINATAGGSWTDATYTTQKAGTWTITATFESLSDTATLTVTANQDQPDYITISPKTSTITVGNTQSYTAEAFDNQGNSLGDVTSNTVFAATGTTVTGNNIRPSAAGTYTVTATYSGKIDTATLTANAQSSSSSSTSSTTSSSSTSTTQTTPKTYTVTFKAQGLPDGTFWSVTLKGTTKTSDTATITFGNLVGGDYTWTADSIITKDVSARYTADNPTSGTIHVSAATTQKIVYITQYYLTLESEIGNPVGQGWYNAGATATLSVDQLANDESGIQYAFAGWQGAGDGSYSGDEATQSVMMSSPITETATWEQASSLYTVAGSAMIIFLLLLLLALLLTRRRRRKKNKPQDFPATGLEA